MMNVGMLSVVMLNVAAHPSPLNTLAGNSFLSIKNALSLHSFLSPGPNVIKLFTVVIYVFVTS